MRRRDKGGRTGKIFAVIALIALGGAIATVDMLRAPVVQVVHSLGVPVSRMTASVGGTFAGLTEGLRSKKVLVEENEALKEELRLLSLKLADWEELKRENNALKGIQVEGDGVDQRVVAGVVARPSQTPYDTLLIDVGIDEDLDVGDTAYAGSVAIGSVSEVLAHTAKVSLFSTVGMRTGVLVGKDQVPAEAVGRGSGNFSIIIPRDIEVVVGDSIRLPGIESNILGTVEVINADPNDAFKQLLFRSPASPYTLSTITIQAQ